MAAIHHRRQPHTLGQWCDEFLKELIIGYHSSTLEVNRDDCLIHPILFISIWIFLLSSVAREMKEKSIARLCACG
jgi:hypothetical protein